MEVAFTIRREDALRALRQITVNRGRDAKDDIVHILVSEYAVTFRAVGTESEWPVDGIGPGVAQVPLPILERVLHMRTTRELQIRIELGIISSGKSSIRHSAVSLGHIPDVAITIPVNATPFEILVIDRVLGRVGALDQGLGMRLEKAGTGLPLALSRAAAALSPYGIELSDLEALVERKMTEAEPCVREALRR
ncbi:MAG: hypothetical protein NVSMB3_13560 [Acidobacteriaceae bacterium]